MCNCMTDIDNMLKEHNGRLCATIALAGNMPVYPTIMVEKIVPRGKKPPAVVPTFCPFCGEKYAKTEAE